MVWQGIERTDKRRNRRRGKEIGDIGTS